MSDDTLTRLAEAEAAQAAMTRFVGPALDLIGGDYLRKLTEIAAKPLPAEGVAQIEKLAVAIKVVEIVRAQIADVIGDGKIAQHEKRYADQIGAITERKRKRFGIA